MSEALTLLLTCNYIKNINKMKKIGFDNSVN